LLRIARKRAVNAFLHFISSPPALDVVCVLAYRPQGGAK